MSRRSPVNFWLLLAATICVDAIAVMWKYTEGRGEHSEWFFIALVFGQLSALCVWALVSSPQQLMRVFVPVVFAVAAALWTALTFPVTAPNVPWEQIALAYSGLWLTHAAGLMAMLWVLKRTTYGRRWGHPVEAGVWQFSMKHLLVAMTTFAVLVFVLRSSEIIQNVWLWVAILIVNNTGVALACMLVQSAPWHVVLRVAAAAGLAALLGSLLYAMNRWPDVIAVNLIHALLLFLWLEVGGILPARGPASAADTKG
ncbi:MAG TPA: hypothetical protein VJ828_20365 [Lacipirellulaceae bacterium]|nr:hypothetical protein [Lacipirellulaceae bacterium]